MFREPAPEKGFPTTAVAIAAVAVVVLAAVLVMLGRKHGTDPYAVQPLAAYASNLVVSGTEVSESESLSGGKQTYVDGRIANKGTATVTGITVQAIFKNDVKMPPQMMTGTMLTVRGRDAYVDAQPMPAEPLGPGQEKEFRVIFENVNDNWNQQVPELRLVGVQTR